MRVSSLGDVLHNLPMVADILRHHPDAQIDWVVEEGYANLVRLNPHVRNIIPFALRRWRSSLLSAATRAEMRGVLRACAQEPYDFVFDTQGLLKTGIIMGLARLAPGGRKVGLANGTEGSGYEAAVAHLPYAQRAGRRAHPRGAARPPGGRRGARLCSR